MRRSLAGSRTFVDEGRRRFDTLENQLARNGHAYVADNNGHRQTRLSGDGRFLATTCNDDNCIDDLAAAVTAARESATPYFVLGLGANILVGDGGFRGLVIRNEDVFIVHDDGSVELYFDGSDIGMGSMALDAFAMGPDGKLVMSFTQPAGVPGMAGWIVDQFDLGRTAHVTALASALHSSCSDWSADWRQASRLYVPPW